MEEILQLIVANVTKRPSMQNVDTENSDVQGSAAAVYLEVKWTEACTAEAKRSKRSDWKTIMSEEPEKLV